MYQPDISRIQSQLFTLQRNYPTIEGLMLVTTGGLVLATTFQKDDSIARLAAVTRTLFLLADDACHEVGQGAMQSVHLTYRRGVGGDDNAPSQVAMCPVGEDAVLVIVQHITAASPQASPLLRDVEHMVEFIAHQITHNA